jgi:hypothetical protein
MILTNKMREQAGDETEDGARRTQNLSKMPEYTSSYPRR